jgi:hypothetical protein
MKTISTVLVLAFALLCLGGCPATLAKHQLPKVPASLDVTPAPLKTL